jgi:hypothetical protein
MNLDIEPDGLPLSGIPMQNVVAAAAAVQEINPVGMETIVSRHGQALIKRADEQQLAQVDSQRR